MNEDNRFIGFFKKITDSEQSLKRLPFYFFLICVLLICLIFKLNKTNHYLEKIAANGTQYIEFETLDTTENDEIETNTSNEDNTETTTFITESETTTVKGTETTTAKKNENKNEPSKVVVSNKENPADNTSSKSTYIININSKKIHRDDCSFVDRMKESNKSVVKLSKSELNEYINNGYTLCSTCGG